MTTSYTDISPRSSYDPLAEFHHPQRSPHDIVQTWRATGRVVLTGAGVGVGLWIVYLIHAALFRADKLAFLHRLVPTQASDLVLSIPQGKIELPQAVTPFVAYILLIVLTGVAARVAAAMVKEGASLLRYEPPVDDPAPAPAPAPPLSTAPHDGG